MWSSFYSGATSPLSELERIAAVVQPSDLAHDSPALPTELMHVYFPLASHIQVCSASGLLAQNFNFVYVLRPTVDGSCGA